MQKFQILYCQDGISTVKPAEPRYVLSLQTADKDQLALKPTDLDLHCLPLSMQIFINNLDQVICLVES